MTTMQCFAVVFVLGCVGLAVGQRCVNDRDQTVSHVTDGRWVGSTKSYHVSSGSFASLSPFFPLDLQYSRPSLRDQLTNGIRAFEFDVVLDISTDPYTVRVLNTPVDAASHCTHLHQCLADVNTWSVANPGHGLLSVVVRVLGSSASTSSCDASKLQAFKTCATSTCVGLPLVSTAADVLCSTTSVQDRMRCVQDNSNLRLDAAQCMATKCRSELDVLLNECSNVMRCFDDVTRGDAQGCCDDSSLANYCPDCITCQYATLSTAARDNMITVPDGAPQQWLESSATLSVNVLSTLLDAAVADTAVPQGYFDASSLADASYQSYYLSGIQSALWTARFTPDRLLKISDVQGSYPTLALALTTQGWPLLCDVRGHTAVFIANTDFDESAFRPYLFFRLSEPSDTSSDLYGAIRYSHPATMPTSLSQSVLAFTSVDAFGASRDFTRVNRTLAISKQGHVLFTSFPSTSASYGQPAPADWGLAPSFYLPFGTPSVCTEGSADWCSIDQIENPSMLSSGRCNLDDRSLTLVLEGYAEQYYASGSVLTNSSDLELTFDEGIDLTSGTVTVTGVEQIVAVSFSSANLPVGAVITSAHVQFQSRLSDARGVALMVAADISSNVPDPLVAGDGTYTVSDRLWSTTAVRWQPSPWLFGQEVSRDQRTPDLSSVLQEVVSQPWWTESNKRLVVLIRRESTDLSVTADATQPQSPNSTRNAESGRLPGTLAPSLKITYRPFTDRVISVPSHSFCEELIAGGNVQVNSTDLELPSDLGWGSSNEQAVGVRFQGLGIERGATIDYAYVQFTAQDTDQGSLLLLVQAQKDTHPFLFPDESSVADSSYNVTDRSTTDYSCLWSPRSWRYELEAGVRQRTCNLGPALQELVNQDSWDLDSAFVVMIQRDQSDTSKNLRVASSGKMSDQSRPVLTARYYTAAEQSPSPSSSFSSSTSLSPSPSSSPSPSITLPQDEGDEDNNNKGKAGPDGVGIGVGVAVALVVVGVAVFIFMRRRSPTKLPNISIGRSRISKLQFDRDDDL